MNAHLKTARDIAVKALANNAAPGEADTVLNQAFEQLLSQVRELRYANIFDNKLEEGSETDLGLLRLAAHIEALQDFANAFLSIEFENSERAS